MLTNAAHLKGLAIHATDGEIGTVDQFYFERSRPAAGLTTGEC